MQFQSQVGSFLEEFLERITLLPHDVKRGLALVRDLDDDSSELLNDIKELQKTYVNKARRRVRDRAGRGMNLAAVAEDKAGLAEIRHKRNTATQRADERVKLTSLLHEMIAYQIQYLDKNMAKFEQGLRARGDFVEDDAPLPEAAAAPAPAPRAPGRGKKRSAAVAVEEAPAPAPAAEVDVPAESKEPVYCYCKRVYYGGMIGCDNDSCPIEWFHFECVSLTEQPKGTWYCPECRAAPNQPTKKKKKR